MKEKKLKERMCKILTIDNDAWRRNKYCKGLTREERLEVLKLTKPLSTDELEEFYAELPDESA